MRTLGLLVTLLAVSPQATTDQKLTVPEGTVITSAEVTGFDINRLSPGLREEIRNSRRHAAEPAASGRTRHAHRGRAAAICRGRAGRHGSRRRARVVFIVGRPAIDRDENVNERYVVEQPTSLAFRTRELTRGLRDDLQALVGQRLDSGEADRLGHASSASCRVTTSRAASSAGASAAASAWCTKRARKNRRRGCASSRSARTSRYHSEHGWGSFLDPAMGARIRSFHANLRDQRLGGSGRGVLGLRASSGNQKAGDAPARRELRMVLVRSGLARRDARRDRIETGHSEPLLRALDVHAAVEVRIDA